MPQKTPTKKPTKQEAATAPESAARRTAATATTPVVPGRSTSRTVTSDRPASFTVPTLEIGDGIAVAAVLQDRLVSIADLALVLKHIHWNVVGPHFVSVHQMLEPQYAGVQAMVDELAERISTLGGVPRALPGSIVEQRSWDDYDLGRADAIAHLGALDLVYTGVITDHRRAIDTIADVDPISEDLLIGSTRELEKYQWFVRSHLADWAGGMSTAGAVTEIGAARAVLDKRASAASRRPAESRA
jgi:starvation-inducible DNA-binding protein